MFHLILYPETMFKGPNWSNIITSSSIYSEKQSFHARSNCTLVTFLVSPLSVSSGGFARISESLQGVGHHATPKQNCVYYQVECISVVTLHWL